VKVNFKELLLRAKEHDARAVDELAALYKPLLIKESIVNGMFDEDIYQELWLTLINCVKKFKF